MQLIVKQYLLRASLLAGLSILLGLALSVLVYKANEQVKSQTIDVVENRLPILAAINELTADLSEQERIVYEYYRSTERQAFLQSAEDIQRTFAMHLSVLKAQNSIANETLKVEQQQQEIISLFTRFDQLMNVYDPDWDALRDVLVEISDKRLALIPTLKHIEKVTTKQVDEGQSETISQINETALLVSLYSGFIVFIAIIVFWYIKQYVSAQAKNTRLALFSQRNPNPILSVNNLGEVLFANPACDMLLQQIGLSEQDYALLVPDNFLSLRQVIANSDHHSFIVEQTLENKILQVSIYWHQELDSYDIHIKDVTEQFLAQQEVKQLAFTSQETGLPNQYKLQDKLTELITHDAEFALGVIAIRQFNEKVATLGGDVISSLVRCVAKVVSKNIPAQVKLYHISDGEFAVLYMGCQQEQVLKALADALVEQTEKSIVTRFGEFFIECDFGFAMYPAHASDSNELLKNSHIALALASQNAHENYCFFDPEYALQTERKASLIDNLRNAIVLDELFLVYQPQLCLHQKKVTGIETLIRWQHDEEIISPADFIPLAEQSGLIVAIGHWILRQACRFAKQFIDEVGQEIVVAVNVSPRQFSHPLFIETVKQALEESQLNPKYLELEITEGVFMHNEQNTLAMMHQLKKLGVQLSIDDFGTGYSSLSYLKQFPIDKLKIDQSFVRDCHNNKEDVAIINTIVGLGKNLGLRLIAEGVEKQRHVETLAEMQCDEIQGYWFSKPLIGRALIEFVQEFNDGNACATHVLDSEKKTSKARTKSM